jgi:23S rRNA (adenine2503-C2)-methyltransferase
LPKGPTNLRGLTHAELGRFLARELDAPSYRTDQIFRWIHVQRAHDFDEMTNLPRSQRAKLSRAASVQGLEVDSVQRSVDGTRKLRLRTSDGQFIESVLIPNEDRGLTQCISSQVGCALTCRFCATASLGFARNLHAWEIIDQVHQARSILEEDATRAGEQWAPRITNLVYMGMGEPLHNFNHVRTSLEVLTDERSDAIAGRRVTLSTAGLVPAIERFVRDGLAQDYGLAVSLNATTDEQRDEIMPINTRWGLEELFAVLRTVPTERRELTFEYVLLDGINDAAEDQRRMVGLLGDLRCHVNLIPFNPHPHSPYRAPAPSRVSAFSRGLRASGVACFVRTPRGQDIAAACGQLALEGQGQGPGPDPAES